MIGLTESTARKLSIHHSYHTSVNRAQQGHSVQQCLQSLENADWNLESSGERCTTTLYTKGTSSAKERNLDNLLHSITILLAFTIKFFA